VVEAPAPAVLRSTLPPPTGGDHIGVVPLHLVDRSPSTSSPPICSPPGCTARPG
jgi:hypothetical protein